MSSKVIASAEPASGSDRSSEGSSETEVALTGPNSHLRMVPFLTRQPQRLHKAVLFRLANVRFLVETQRKDDNLQPKVKKVSQGTSKKKPESQLPSLPAPVNLTPPPGPTDKNGKKRHRKSDGASSCESSVERPLEK